MIKVTSVWEPFASPIIKISPSKMRAVCWRSRATWLVMTYFDHNATAPLHPAARQAWLEASEKFNANPSSPHRLGGRANAALEDARSRLAGMMGCHPHDIVWTSGATE